MIILLATLTAIVILSKKLQHPKFKSKRVKLFILLAIFGVLPMIHGFCVVGVDLALKPIWGITKLYILLTIGLTCYHFKFPERLSPGTFDYWVFIRFTFL